MVGSQLVQMICQLVIFMICAKSIVNFRPNASYEKYLKMLVSAMLLVQIILLFGGMFATGIPLGNRTEQLARLIEDSVARTLEQTVLTETLEFELMGEQVEKKDDIESKREICVEVETNQIKEIKIEWSSTETADIRGGTQEQNDCEGE